MVHPIYHLVCRIITRGIPPFLHTVEMSYRLKYKCLYLRPKSTPKILSMHREEAKRRTRRREERRTASGFFKSIPCHRDNDILAPAGTKEATEASSLRSGSGHCHRGICCGSAGGRILVPRRSSHIITSGCVAAATAASPGAHAPPKVDLAVGAVDSSAQHTPIFGINQSFQATAFVYRRQQSEEWR